VKCYWVEKFGHHLETTDSSGVRFCESCKIELLRAKCKIYRTCSERDCNECPVTEAEVKCSAYVPVISSWNKSKTCDGCMFFNNWRGSNEHCKINSKILQTRMVT
jgi:hypothetical protein